MKEIDLDVLIPRLYNVGLLYADDATLEMMGKFIKNKKVDKDRLEELIGEEALKELRKYKRELS